MLDQDKLRKIFYYSLKRTGKYEAAEELSQDIALEIITMLSKGYKPDNFNAWMWTVARCRYAVWARKKRILRENISFGDITDTQHNSLQADVSVEDSVVADEQINLLRRELTLLSKEYREIAVAYYIHSTRIADISKAMNLPEGTIKRKLHEIRKYIREGMEMVRTYGTRSYNPENIRFKIDRYNTEGDIPNSLVESKLAKNILLEAYTNPCTTEELSISLGVASPYLEETLDKLVEGQLLRRLDDGRYETDFVILDRKAQEDLYKKAEEIVKDMCPKVMLLAVCDAKVSLAIEQREYDIKNIKGQTFIDTFANEIGSGLKPDNREETIKEYNDKIAQWKNETGNRSVLGEITVNESMWFYLFNSIFSLTSMAMVKYKFEPVHKTYKGEWSIIGYEDWNNPLHDYIVRLDADAFDGGFLLQYSFDGKMKLSDKKLQPSECRFIIDLLSNSKKYSELTIAEASIADQLKSRRLLTIDNDIISPCFPVRFLKGLDQFNMLYKNVDIQEDLKALADKAVDKSLNMMDECSDVIYKLLIYNKERIKQGLPEWLYSSADFAAADILTNLRDLMFKYAVENGYLEVPEDPDKPLGIGLYVK